MQIIRNPAQIPESWLDAVITIGNFDGVHQGHQHILQAIEREASRVGRPATVVTFEPHPLTVLQPQRQLKFITTLADRLRLLGEAGIEQAFVWQFTQELAALGAEDFLNLLYRYFQPRLIYVGYDFRFSRERQGDYEVLQEFAGRRGFQVEQGDVVKNGGEIVSSTRIRWAIEAGNLALARKLLGRHHFISGVVVQERGVGHRMGYPTANLPLADIVLPPDGIYAARASWQGLSGKAITYIGVRPTFGLHDRVCETYLLDRQVELYGQMLRVEFMEFIREDRKFEGPEELVRQIEDDVRRCEVILADAMVVEPSAQKVSFGGQAGSGSFDDHDR